MKNKKFIYLIISILIYAFFITGCEMSSEYLVRIRMESSVYENPTIVINIEGYDGDAVESALVSVTAPGNRIYILDYLTEYGAYRKVLESRSSGTYIINIDSIIDTAPTTIEIEHTILTTAPNVTAITDASGNNASNGDSINSTDNISVTWTDLGSDIIYYMAVTSVTSTEYEISSTTPSCVIPANILNSASSHAVTITAVKQYGDPELITSNYVSTNSIDGSSYVFSTN